MSKPMPLLYLDVTKHSNCRLSNKVYFKACDDEDIKFESESLGAKRNFKNCASIFNPGLETKRVTSKTTTTKNVNDFIIVRCKKM